MKMKSIGMSDKQAAIQIYINSPRGDGKLGDVINTNDKGMQP